MLVNVLTLNGEGADSLIALLNLVELDLVLFLNFLVLLDDRSGELNRRLNLLYYLFRLLLDDFLLLDLSFLLFSVQLGKLYGLSILNLLVCLCHFLKLETEIEECCSKANDDKSPNVTLASAFAQLVGSI